ncbi:hypothetical protein [Duncaniella dubosii]|jgi:hypothetical protein|uniref:hypothetical protein n=1 Tax=Duncaniella dubosii TaxID=2518971 RepID=UPI0023F2725E|nr:hypothetical protein [Duncaniella dubosii]MCX4285452.1 hypothetical protein [Duncaniella dubosii]
MINLTAYKEYWERLAQRIPLITGVIPVTVDEAMAKRITSLQKGSVTLFVLPPAAESEAKNIDSFKEENECVVFVMEKYDPQRRETWSVLETSQTVVEELKSKMLDDLAAGCPLMRFDVSTLNTLPETQFFAGFAGWSVGFKIIT